MGIWLLSIQIVTGLIGSYSSIFFVILDNEQTGTHRKNDHCTSKKLPENKVAEVSEFADLILQRNQDKEITLAIGQLSAKTKSYQFLEEEEDLYTVHDVKAPYNGKS